MRHWKPLYPHHAIQQATAVIQFHQPIPDLPWRRIQSLARSLSSQAEMVTEKPLQQVGFSLSLDGAPAIAPSETVGLEFLRFERPDFYSDKFSVQRNVLMLENWRYTRWNAFSRRIQTILNPILEIYLSLVPIATISLEYHDRFDAAEPNSSPDCGEVIRHPSPLIAEQAFSSDRPWHCQIGYFTETEIANSSLLANVDVQVADIFMDPFGRSRTRAARIRTALVQQFPFSESDGPQDVEASTDFIGKCLDRLHIQLKTTLRQVITDDAAREIAL